MISVGMFGLPITPHDLANPIATETITVPAPIPKMFHLEKIRMARATYPIPFTAPPNVPPIIVSIAIPPASPAKNPAAALAAYLVFVTDTPAAANEYGFSPEALSLSPHLVFCNTNHVTAINDTETIR
jgi:hypothetical protein